MAKLTDIPVVTSLDDADLIYGVDVSDPTDDPAGSSVAITKANLLAEAGGGAAGNATSHFLIDEITDPGTTSFDFGAVDLSGYDRVYVEGSIRSARAGNDDDPLYLWLNGDTTDANYFYQRQTTSDGSTTGPEGPNNRMTNVPAALAPANSYGEVTISIESPNSSALKTLRATASFQGGASTSYVEDASVVWDNTAAITDLELASVTGSVLSGTVRLIGVRAVSLTATNLPVVQSAKVFSDGTLLWSTEDGWSVVKAGSGLYDITFPTSAPSADAQSITAAWNHAITSANEYFACITLITANTCRVQMTNDGGVETDVDFGVTRSLDPAPAQAIVATQPAGTVVKEEIGRITDPAGGEYEWVVPANTYDRLMIQGSLVGSIANAQLNIYLNNDEVDANYTTGLRYSSSATGVSQAELNIPWFGYSSDTAGIPSTADAVIESPNSSSTKRIVVNIDSSDTIQRISHENIITSITAAVDRVKVKGYLTNVPTGTLILYGERTI